MCASPYVIQVDLLWGVTRPLAWSGGDELKHIFLVKHSFVKSYFFQLASALDLRRRVEFLDRSKAPARRTKTQHNRENARPKLGVSQVVLSRKCIFMKILNENQYFHENTKVKVYFHENTRLVKVQIVLKRQPLEPADRSVFS